MPVPVDLEALSNRLVTHVAAVKEGDIVLISGRARDMELLENIVIDVRKVGAFPLLTVGSDRIVRKYLEKVPEKYDSQSPELDLKLAAIATVTISIASNEAEDLLAGAPSARLAAVNKAAEPVAELFQKRAVRQVQIGNDLYPTAWRARHFGISQEELAKTFWEAVNADYSEVQSAGERMKAVLSSGKELQITNPNGTDLKIGIGGRPFFISDGVISPEDVKKGGPAVVVFLPAGELYCAPVPGTAEGKAVVAQSYYNGMEVTDLTLTFVKGRMTSIAGSGSGFAKLKADYDAEGEGKDLFAFVDFGINPKLRIWPASKIGNWVQSGMVSIGIGNNTWAGGDNKLFYGYSDYLPGSTVALDGRTIIENGVLKF
jgi:leucyl aminopeptidase (aminopeptidase T)